MSDAIFDTIQADPDICSNCFRRTHKRFERNYRVETYQDDEGEWDVRPVEVQGIEITLPGGDTQILGGKPDRVFRQGEQTTKVPERGAHRGLRTVCVCGFRWGPQEVVEEWKNRPLNKKTFFEYADRLLERVRENGVDLDEDTYYEELDEMKSDPDQQFADDDMYRDALHRASVVGTVRP